MRIKIKNRNNKTRIRRKNYVRMRRCLKKCEAHYRQQKSAQHNSKYRWKNCYNKLYCARIKEKWKRACVFIDVPDYRWKRSIQLFNNAKVNYNEINARKPQTAIPNSIQMEDCMPFLHTESYYELVS